MIDFCLITGLKKNRNWQLFSVSIKFTKYFQESISNIKTKGITEGYPSTEEPAKYPPEVLNEFNENENFISLTKDTKLIDYKNAQIILIGAREGKDVIKNDIGIEIEAEEEG